MWKGSRRDAGGTRGGGDFRLYIFDPFGSAQDRFYIDLEPRLIGIDAANITYKERYLNESDTETF